MKLLLTIPFMLFSIISFSQDEETERVWEKIPNAPVITTQNAATFTSYENSLESALNYFYASQIRKDEEWKKVFIPSEDWSDRIQYKMEKYAKWTITKFYLISKTEFEPGKFWVKVNMEIAIDGKTDGGIDQAEVQFINGKWVITSVPT
jgi:hypothetical protein